MMRHPLSEVMTRGQSAGDALRALVVRQGTEPDLTSQQQLDLSVALDGVRRAMAPLARQRDAGLRMAAQRLMAALDAPAEPAVEKTA